MLYGPALSLAVGLCAAAPVIAAMARALREGWQPVADRGIIATRAFDVFSSHTPLVGQYSFAGTVTGKLTYSLGPMLYWLLAPAAHVGAPQSFVWTMGVVNVACVVCAVALARRRGGTWLMVAAAIGIALMCRSLAANNFYDIWNPSAGLFPLLALIFVCWSLACGEHRLLPLAALLASYLLQLEDSFIPTALAASAVGLGGVIAWRFSARGSLQRRERRSIRRWALAAALVVAACWTPTVVDQVAHEGNFVHVVQAATERKSSLGFSVGVHAVERTVGVRPWWLQRPREPFSRKHDVLHASSSLADLSSAVILGWLVLAVVLAVLRRRRDVAAGALLALLLCAAVYSIASSTPTKRMLAETLGYTLWSATTVGMFTWLVTLWSALELSGAGARLRARRAGVRGGAVSAIKAQRAAPRMGVAAMALAALAALALAALAGAGGAAAGEPDEHAFEFAALAALNARLGAVPKGHSVYLNARLDGLITPLRPELTYDLRRRGVRALGVGAYLRTGHWYELHEHPYDYIVWVYDDGRPPLPGARVIAKAHITSGGRRHTVEVAISHVRPHAPPARRPAAPAAAADPPAGWSPPRRLAACAAAGPAVAFPSEAPSIATGAGAIVWAAAPGACTAQGPGAGVWTLSLAALGPGEVASSTASSTFAGQAPLSLQALGASAGRITAAAALRGSEGTLGARYLVAQGRARASPSRVLGGRASAVALARAYLGDVVVASVSAAPALVVRVERYFSDSFSAPLRIALEPGALSSLTATMDYRSDVLLAWQQGGSIYAHLLRASGHAEPTQRLGAAGPGAQISALVSDDNHGMVAWTDTTGAASGAHTTIYLDFSSSGVRFPAPVALASFADPGHAGAQPGALALVRLSSENVLLAWTDRERGHYVVRAAPAVYAASRPSALLSDPRAQSLLSALAAGPAGEAIALWYSSAGAALDASRAELWSARTFIARGDRPAALARAQLTAAGHYSAATVAVDPASDSAVAAWLAGTPGENAAVQYAVGGGASGYRPSPPSAPPARAAGTHWLRITLGALAGAVLLVGALVLRRRIAQRFS